MPRTKAGQVAASWLLHQELHGPTSTVYCDEHGPRTQTLTALLTRPQGVRHKETHPFQSGIGTYNFNPPTL